MAANFILIVIVAFIDLHIAAFLSEKFHAISAQKAFERIQKNLATDTTTVVIPAHVVEWLASESVK